MGGMGVVVMRQNGRTDVPSASISISLCLVVRDEELFIRECLDSVRGIVDEVVVVDTGSSDGTVGIARDAGARVFEEPWPGDLARAHDLPIRHARGEWILSLDGDEALDRDRGHEVRALTSHGEYDGYVFTVRNYVYVPRGRHRHVDPADPQVHGARGWLPSRNVRLFRRDPRFRHEGRVHQTVRHAMADAGAAVGTSSIPIHHYGYLSNDRHKSPLYLALARQQAADRPDDPKSQLELGIVLVDERRWDEALECFARAQALGDAAESRFLSGAVHLERRRPDAAIAGFRAALAQASRLEHFVEEAEVWQALGQAYLDRDDDAAAAAALRRCLDLRPDSPDAACNLIGVLARAADTGAASRMAAWLTARYPGLAASWEARGCAVLMAGDHQQAIAHFARALDIDSGRSSSQVNLAIAQARAGDNRAAVRTMQAAVAMDREGDVAGRLGRSMRPAPRSAIATAPELGREGVLSVIAHLGGGAAYVATRLARALGPARPQLVAALDPGDFTGELHGDALNALGVGVIAVRDAADLAALQARTRPGVVIHHWWHTPYLDRVRRQGDERLIVRSASPLPMPTGYDGYVTLSAFQARHQRHIPPERLHCIPNGIDVGEFAAAIARDDYWPALAGATRPPIRIAMLSRLDPDKFMRRLPHVLAPVLDLPVVVAIAGRGGRRYEIEPELDERGMSAQVRFLGPLPQRDVPSFLAGADIGLHLTETHQESHSLAVLQMMAAGLPVVAQPRGCLPELIENGVSGHLAFDERELAGALRRLILDDGQRRSFGAAAQASAARYDIHLFEARWRDLVSRLV
jgi:glycosyltransferase involved in cell wall biosynthesis/Tfp pilus assembly protein PilF